jgi:hypothetical protein
MATILLTARAYNDLRVRAYRVRRASRRTAPGQAFTSAP